MFRTACVPVALLAAALFVAAAGAAPPPGLKLGEKFEGELKNKKGTYVGQPGTNMRFSNDFYVAEVPVTLKAGQAIAISATVIGKGRPVAITLQDPTMNPLYGVTFAVKTVQLAVEEVNASGKYTILVISDQVGPFTLRATAASEEDLDEARRRWKRRSSGWSRNSRRRRRSWMP